MRSFVGWWILLAGLYLLLAAKLKPDEEIAAAIVGLFGAALITAIDRGDTAYAFRARWIIRLAQSFLKAFSDSVTVLAAALSIRPPEGDIHQVPFDASDDSPETRGRRAMVTETMTLTPNTVVLSVEPQASRMLVHQLVPTGKQVGGGDREWPS